MSNNKFQININKGLCIGNCKFEIENSRFSGWGFTLLELLLSVAIIGILAGLSLPVYRSMQTRNDLDNSVVTTVQTLRRAQVLSQANEGDSAWGVKLLSGNIVLFKGATYATRDTSLDELYDLQSSISISGTSEYVFAKLTGDPNASGSITLTSIDGSRTVTINEKGMVTY